MHVGKQPIRWVSDFKMNIYSMSHVYLRVKEKYYDFWQEKPV